MRAVSKIRPTWKALLAENRPLQLPVAHDALVARLIERAGFPAYQIGGLSLVGTMHAVPDIELEHMGERAAAAANILRASHLPAMIDADDGYGDVKNVTRCVLEYEWLRASAIFLEDQKPPKRCGHLAGKELIEPSQMQNKLRAALAARTDPGFFIMARTDAIEPEGLDSALSRAARYLETGVDGIYLEGAHSRDELERIGREFGSVPLATTILEGGGETPWVSPQEMAQMGFSMILYPTTLLFQMTAALQLGLDTLKMGQPMPAERGVSNNQYNEIVDMPYWVNVENRFQARQKPK